LAPKSEKTQKIKGFTLDAASGQIISAGAEEINATQPLLEILINEAGWKPAQIVSRPNQWRVPASPSAKRIWPVDVAIFDDPKHARDPDHVRILCECKRPDIETGTEQLKIYLDREPHARVGIWFNGIEHKVVYKTTAGYEVAPDGTPILTPADPLAPVGKKVLSFPDLKTPPSLVPVFRRIRDRLATLDRNVNRDEEILPDISLLLLLKIRDEQDHRFSPAKPLAFQVHDEPTKTADRIKDLLDLEVKKNAALFGAEDREIRFQIDDDSISYIVENLQNFRLLSNDTDAVAQAFQVIRGKAYKGEEGQYFTPPSVVRIAVAAVNPGPSDRVIDPACGSGSFLASALNNVVERLADVYGTDKNAITLARRDWSTSQLYAIDKDAVSVRLSKAYLSMLGDGSTHVFKQDSIRTARWPASLRATIQNGAFNVVVTNPPFGTKLKVPGRIGREENFELSRIWKKDKKTRKWKATGDYEERDLGLLFLERSMRLLGSGGRLAIVLPDTYLFSDSYAWLVQWLSRYKITHSINVPIEAFEPHCRAKTSIIVVEKTEPKAGHEITGSVCETYGEDKHGRPRYKIVDGLATDELDDEMRVAAQLLKDPSAPVSKLKFRFLQADAVKRGVLVASFWWRQPYLDALNAFANDNDCQLVSVGDLLACGDLQILEGHGSPSSHYKGKGEVPYVKVVDIKNWRVVENPKYFMPRGIAEKYTAKRPLQPYDLLMPTRASKNIGLFGVVMPWQTDMILTREIFIWRMKEKGKIANRWLFLALASLKVVHDQFNFIVLMQMNREDLGDRYKELLIPVPKTEEARERWTEPVRRYFKATAAARASYEALSVELNPSLFADRP
jgi:type I restriction enzyme M protein